MSVTKFMDLIFILLKKFCWQKLIDSRSRVGSVQILKFEHGEMISFHGNNQQIKNTLKRSFLPLSLSTQWADELHATHQRVMSRHSSPYFITMNNNKKKGTYQLVPSSPALSIIFLAPQSAQVDWLFCADAHLNSSQNKKSELCYDVFLRA